VTPSAENAEMKPLFAPLFSPPFCAHSTKHTVILGRWRLGEKKTECFAPKLVIYSGSTIILGAEFENNW